MKKQKIALIGGGAAGFFAALSAAEKAKSTNQPVEIHILESNAQFLRKVKISGGGRCNVTHNCFEIKDFVKNYPRGQKALISPFYQFQALDTVSWFKQRGIHLIAEPDGRMFPSSHRSQTIIDCFLKEAKALGVLLRYSTPVRGAEIKNNKFQLTINSSEEIFDKVLLATGSSAYGYKAAEAFGHSITERAPSLFSFKIKHPLLNPHSGVSFKEVHLKLTVKEKKFEQRGPLLITHWGLSGPAILKLSAWAAREMKSAQYKATLRVNWLNLNINEYHTLLLGLQNQHPKSLLLNKSPQGLSKAFWQSLIEHLDLPREKVWAEVSKKEFEKIKNTLFSTPFEVLGQNRFKEEFVECGGIDLKEIDFKTMQSKIVPGLFFAGELLDIDGITGGFNFQNAWTTGWIAGQNIIRSSY